MEGNMVLDGDLMVQHVKNLEAEMVSAPLSWKLKNSLRKDYIQGAIANEVVAPIANAFGVATMTSELSAIKTHADGHREDYGVVCRRLVTDTFVWFVVDQLQTESSVFGDFKWHEAGTGTTNPAVTDTGIETTAPNSAPVAGSQTEGATGNIYKSVGTCSFTGADAVTEHVLSNVETTAQGSMMDRHEFAVITTASGDSIEFTYQLTLSSGG